MLYALVGLGYQRISNALLELVVLIILPQCLIAYDVVAKKSAKSTCTKTNLTVVFMALEK
jgi:hypothetical protein